MFCRSKTSSASAANTLAASTQPHKIALIEISEETSRCADVRDSVWDKSKRAGQNSIRCDWIIRKQNNSKLLCGAVEWTVACHSDNRISDNKMRPNSRADIQDALVDPCPMQNVFRPAIAIAGDNSEHVFQAQRDAGPVVCFDFRHRHDEIRCDYESWKPQVAETGIVSTKLRFDQFVTIEIDKVNLALGKLIRQSGLVEQQFRVAVMPRTFADGDRRGIQPQESLSGRSDKLRLRVHRPSGNVFDDIGLEKNRFAADVQIEEAESLVDECVEFVRVPVRLQNGDT